MAENSNLETKLEDLINFLADYGVTPTASPDLVRNAIEKGYAAEYFRPETGLFTTQILISLEDDLQPTEHRIISTADWWFDDEVDWGFKNSLLLKENLTFEFPESEEADQILTAKCGDKVVKVKYEEVDLTKRFRFGIEINVINHFLEKIGSGLRIAEITDRGEDFAVYAVVEKDKVDQFRVGFADYLEPGSVTDYQSEVEEKHRPSLVEQLKC